jgi:hypothetical protein
MPQRAGSLYTPEIAYHNIILKPYASGPRARGATARGWHRANDWFLKFNNSYLCLKV